MARINSANYYGTPEPIEAFEVFENFQLFDTEKFTCIFCGSKLQFNRGIKFSDPHFKNWPNVNHSPTCLILEVQNQKFGNSKNLEIEAFISTIIPRAKNLKMPSEENEKRRRIQRLYGERTKHFLNTLSSLNTKEINEYKILTEDGQLVLISNLIKSQDEIINKFESGESEFICVLRGVTKKAVKIGSNIKLPLTEGGKYGNTKAFDLFIPFSFVEKNERLINTIENSLIYCYGVPVKNEFGYKIDIYSISRQVKVLKDFKSNKFI